MLLDLIASLIKAKRVGISSEGMSLYGWNNRVGFLGLIFLGLAQ